MLLAIRLIPIETEIECLSGHVDVIGWGGSTERDSQLESSVEPLLMSHPYGDSVGHCGDDPIGDDPIGDDPIGDDPIGDVPIGDDSEYPFIRSIWFG